MIGKPKFCIEKRALIRYVFFSFIYLCFYPSFVTRIVPIPFWGSICNTAIYISVILFLPLFLVNRKFNSYIVTSCALFVILNVATLLVGRRDDLSASTVRMIRCIAFVLITEYLIQFLHPKQSLSILMLVMEIINYANFVSMFIYPNGMYHTEWINGQDVAVKTLPGYIRTNERVHWLMGHQSTTIRFILPAICIAILYDYVCENSTNKNRMVRNTRLSVRSACMFCVCFGELLISSSGGNYIVTIIFFLLVFLFKKSLKIRMWWMPCLIVAFYSISSLLAQSSIFDLIGLLVGRSVDLISRCRTWKVVLDSCSKRLFLGYGYINESSVSLRHLMDNYGNPHSDYLWILFEGGIIALVIFAVLLIIIGRKSERVENSIERYTFAAFVCFMIMMLDDDHIFRSQYMLVIPSLCYHASFINNAANGR